MRQSLNFLHVDELKDLCEELSLHNKGVKRDLVSRIVQFIETGEKSVSPKLPQNSRAKSGQIYEMTENSLMLKGAYKNDLKTRIFFKQLIGNYFHFTAFGIDWLNERWMEGNPPTYQEFANMWRAEYQRRKLTPAAPKEEWAYINFVQAYLKTFPNSPREDVNASWERERQKHKTYVNEELRKIAK
jgi:hypothetical protein